MNPTLSEIVQLYNIKSKLMLTE